MIEISKGFKVAMEVLRDLHASTDEDLTKLKTKRVTLQSLKTEVHSRYSEEKQGILQQEKVFYELVHKQSEKLLTTLDEGLNKITISMQANENQTNKDYKAAESRKQIFQDAIDSNNVQKVFNTVGKENTYIAKKTEISLEDLTKYKSLHKFVPGCIEQEAISTFYGTVVDIAAQPIPQEPQFKLLNQYSSIYPQIQCIICCPDRSLWISNFGSKEMQNISLLSDGLIIKKGTVNVSDVAGIQLSNSGDLFLSRQRSNLYIYHPKTGKIVKSKFTVAPLITNSAISGFENNKIIVGAREDGTAFPPKGPRKVIVMNMEGGHEITYYLDNESKPLFTLPYRITTDNNNDIYVIDALNDNYEGRVIKLNPRGGVSHVYMGHPEINDSDNPLIPADLKSTPFNNVIVADDENGILHILDNNLQCIHFIRTKELGIASPLSIEIDNKSIFIGCDGEIFEVNFSGV
ncbi:unnamed protein product [Mytilus edulis]|uniref:Tripartite motif-containing protein 2 n=1 Tax=Mytilus edulis TaxID=6550 RepID=A0A8S3SV73_MYTED|nr:unnamed protein product [Mytilus edulis]